MNHTFKSNKLNKETQSTDVRKLEDALRKVKGVKKVVARASEGSIDVDYGTEVKPAAIKDAASAVGFPMQDPS